MVSSCSFRMGMARLWAVCVLATALGRESGAGEALKSARVTSGYFPHVDNEADYVFWPSPDPESDAYLFNSVGDYFPLTWGADDALYGSVGDGVGLTMHHPEFAPMEEGYNYELPTRENLDVVTEVLNPYGFYYPRRTPPKVNFNRFTGKPGDRTGMTPPQGKAIWRIHEQLGTPGFPPAGRCVISCSLISIGGTIFLGYYNSELTPGNPYGHGFAMTPLAGIMRWNGSEATPGMELYDPAARQWIPINRENFEHGLWRDYRFTTPVFIQFGRDYGDYPLWAGEGSPLWVYAVSTHGDWRDRDDLYLGRGRYVAQGPHTEDEWEAWEYWIGLDEAGNAMWTPDVRRAKSILHAPGDIGFPGVMYEKHTDQFIMTTYVNNNDPIYGNNNDKQCVVWSAAAPWGPWRRIFTNDFNGLQNRIGEETRRQGGGGYSNLLVPKYIEPVSGGVRVWLAAAGFWNPDYVPFNTMIDRVWETWERKWPQTYYTMCFTQMELREAGEFDDGLVSAAIESKPGDGKTSVLGETWVGGRLRTGERPLRVHQLGRHYVTSNRLKHPLRLLRVEGSGALTEVARAEVQTGLEQPQDAMSFQYGDIEGGGVELSPNTDYLLLSREGLAADSASRPVALATDLSEATATRSDWTGYLGFQFQTGPQGLRITHVGKYDTGPLTGNRIVVIDEITQSNGVNFTTQRVLTSSIGPSDPVGPDGYRLHALPYGAASGDRTVDLKPLTRYMFGVQHLPGDAYYGGPAGGPGRARLTFDPEMVQFMNATRMQGIVGNWRIGEAEMRGPGSVYGPVIFRAQMPDLFYGEAHMGAGWEPLDAMPRLRTNPRLDLEMVSAAMYNFSVGFGWRRFDGAQACIGPIDLVFEGSGGEERLVEGFAGTAWQNHPRRGTDTFKGWIGMQIRVGSEDLRLKAIGRYVPGNILRRPHVLMVSAASDKTFHASTVLTAGNYEASRSALGFVYKELETPLVLKAGGKYFVGSEEYSEAEVGSEVLDLYFGQPNEMPVTRAGGALELTASVRAPWGYPAEMTGVKVFATPPGEIFGPLNLRYEPLEREAVTGLEIKTVNDNWTGFHGWEFRVGERPVAVGKLGRYCFAGSRERHEVRIVPVKRGPYDEPANPSTVIASVLIDAGQAAADGMVYAALAQPVRLEPNTRYMIASYETAGGDPFAADVELTLDPAIEWVGGCYTLSAPDQPGGYWYPVQSIEPGRALNAVSFVMQ